MDRFSEISSIRPTPDGPTRRAGAGHVGSNATFDAILTDVERDLEQLQELTDRSRAAARSDSDGTDPGTFRRAIAETEEAFRSARHVRSQLLAAYLSARPNR